MPKKHPRNLSIFLVVFMCLSLLAPANIIAKQDQHVSFKTKIDTKLLEAYEQEENVPYIVLLKEQTDTEEVARSANKEAKKNSLAVAETKTSIQQAVVSTLQSNAHTTQKNIVSYLKQDKENIQDYHSFYIVNAIAVTGTKESAEKIAKLPEVKSVIPDQKHKLDPLKENEVKNNDTEWNIDRIGAPDVWDDGVTGEGAVIASIDSGVNWDHPALKRQYRGYNPEDPDHPSNEFNWHDPVMGFKNPSDSDGHGTHTMGTMVGQEKDGKNKIGVAPGAKWISARAFYLGEGYDHHILEAAEWVLAPTDSNGIPHPEKAPDVVNNSWGGIRIDNDWFLPMVQAWRDAGIVPVFSVGNTGPGEHAEPSSASAPGNYKEAIAVGATDDHDELAGFSLRGPTEMGDIKPDLVAPGVQIRSSIRNASYEQFNGTSMAAPHVAATVALMKQADPSLSIEQIESVLKQTAIEKTDDKYPESPNNGYGFGLLDAKAAVEMVQSGIGTISGQVMSTGEDQDHPTYELDERKAVYKNKDEEFIIRAMDDVSVNEVTLTITLDNGTEKSYKAEAIAGNHIDGHYKAIVPVEDITGESLEYVWTIKDFSGKVTKTDVHVATIKEGVSSGYSEDFEGYPDGWYSFGRNNSWEWGEPTYGPNPAASGEKVMGTNLRGLYDGSSDMTLMMPPVLVDKHTVLRFKTWYKLQLLGMDTGTVFASEDGETWEPLHQVRQANTKWHEIGLDLSDYAGKKIYIAFNLESAVGNQDDGWYIDDVKLVEDSSKANVANKVFDEGTSFTAPKNEDEKTLHSTSNRVKDRAADQIPVEATVTVEETGWKTETDLRNGGFTIYHAPGNYRLHVDAYGYESATEEVFLSENGHVSPEIHLTPLPKQVVSGKIENKKGAAIEGAKVFLLEDEKSERVTSGEDGTYQLEAYEGTYTLKIFADGYYGKTEKITVEAGKDIPLDVTLAAFYKSGDAEISYDNGHYSKNLAFSKKGNGFAVKMSLKEGESAAMLTGAKLQFWADHVPKPGGDDILIAIYDATGENGAPGNKLAGPIEAKAKRDLYSWTDVDLSHLGIVVEDDFYIAYLQADDYPYIPGFVSDGDSANFAERSWEYVGGQWLQSDDSVGNFMIRANVDYGDDSRGDAPIENADDLDKLVTQYADSGDITSESAARMLHMHLSIVSQFEEKEMSDKVIKHLEGFKQLLNRQRENKQISSKAYNELEAGANELIQKWNSK